jgi:P4 family phage/plasmid primase-like protien
MTNKDSVKKIKLKLEELLNEHRTAKGQTDYTHLSLGGICFPGKFTFNDSKSKSKLAKYLGKAMNSGLIYSIAEKPKEYGPLKVDIDMNYPIDQHDNKRLYNDDMIIQLISLYRDTIKKYCSIVDNELTCCLFEKNNFTEKNGEIKDGIHMIFPYITLHYKIRHLITNDVSTQTTESGMFEHLSNPCVIDSAVVNNNAWMMYGCAKPNNPFYKLTKVYDVDNNLINSKTLGNSTELIKLFSLRSSKWSELNATLLNNDINDEFVSQSFSDLGIEKDKSETVFDDMIPEDKIDMIEKAIKIVDMLNVKRAHDYHTWIRVGWALHNTDKSLLSSWIGFSKRSKKFQPGECERRWRNMRDDGYTVRSLMLWAKDDNPDQYNEFIKDDFNKLLKKNAVNNTFMIAKALHCKYFDRFVCVNPRDNIWYHFREHRWQKCSNGGYLITLMSSTFSGNYCKAAGECSHKANKAQGGDRTKFLNDAILFNKIADNLMDINFKERLMKEARYLFFDDRFLERLDENKDLICFKNGVYDLKLRSFRPGHPDDHISMSTNVHYVKWSDNNPYAKPINQFFEKVLINKEVREYFLSRISTCVSGENREEKFYFLTGSGSNGKSLTFSLVSEALGDYYISCPITIITRKRGAASNASPELARLKGPRCGVFQEPGLDEQLNIGIFKELSGNDRFMVRGLYKEPIEVKPQVKYWLTCNDLPEVPSDDGGTWRRIRVIDFSSKFIETPDSNNKNEFLLDDTLKTKISNWAPAFASYLIHLYTTTYDVEEKIPEPEAVKLSTNRYRKEQDVIREYFETNLQVSDNKKDIIKKRDLWTHFRLWYKEGRDPSSIPKNKKLYDFLENELKINYTQSGWKCIKFRVEGSESEHEESSNELDLDL